MISYVKLFVSAVAVSALASGTVSAAEKEEAKKKNLRRLHWGEHSKCAKKMTPPNAWHKNVRCPEGWHIKATDLIYCASGDGFDHHQTDFDILRALILYTGLKPTIDGLDGKKCTCFNPTDLGIVNTVKSLAGKSHWHYDEAGAYQWLVDNFSKKELKLILLYHISCDGTFGFEDLQKKVKLRMLAAGDCQFSEPAQATPNCDERVRMLDTFRMHVKLDWGHAKLHNVFVDIDTKNCVWHATKALSLPATVLLPDKPWTTTMKPWTTKKTTTTWKPPTTTTWKKTTTTTTWKPTTTKKTTTKPWTWTTKKPTTTWKPTWKPSWKAPHDEWNPPENTWKQNTWHKKKKNWKKKWHSHRE